MSLPQELYRYQMLLDGCWVEAQPGKRVTRASPARGIPVGTYPLADETDVHAVAAARRAFDHIKD